jgi:hypothetical protein
MPHCRRPFDPPDALAELGEEASTFNHVLFLF